MIDRPQRHTAMSLLLLAACSVTPSPLREPDLGIAPPDAWHAAPAGDGAILDAWWLDFGDPTVIALITEALASNHDLAAAAARMATAAAEARSAGAILWPSLDASLNSQRQRQNLSGLPGAGGAPIGTTSNAFGVALNFQWELDLWGGLRAGARAVAAELQSEQAAYRAAALSLAAQTAKAWFAVTEAHLQLQLAEQTVASYRDTHQQASNRVAAGIQSPIDGHLTLANLAAAEANLQARREILSRTGKQLEVLLGRYPAGEIDGADDLPQLAGSVPAGLPAAIVRRRPDLAVLERRLAAATERVDTAEAALYPRLSLTGSTGSSSREFEDLLSGDFFLWSLAGGLVQPLFAGGRLRADVDAAEGRAEAAAAAFAHGTLTAFFEVEAALAAETLLAAQEEALARAAGAAQQAVTVADNRYGQGIEQLLVVLESQRRALDATSSLLAVRRARLENRIDLHLALGGGFEALPFPAVSDATTGDRR